MLYRTFPASCRLRKLSHVSGQRIKHARPTHSIPNSSSPDSEERPPAEGALKGKSSLRWKLLKFLTWDSPELPCAHPSAFRIKMEENATTEEAISCDCCQKEAMYKCFGGPMKRPPGGETDAVPFPENYVFRCEEHRRRPEPSFGKLWAWYPKNERFAHMFKSK